MPLATTVIFWPMHVAEPAGQAVSSRVAKSPAGMAPAGMFSLACWPLAGGAVARVTFIPGSPAHETSWSALPSYVVAWLVEMIAVGGFFPCLATACSFAVAVTVSSVSVAAESVAVRNTSGPYVAVSPGPRLFGGVQLSVRVVSGTGVQRGSENAGLYSDVVVALTRSFHVIVTVMFTRLLVLPPFETVTKSA